jgi:predicted secreted protein
VVNYFLATQDSQKQLKESANPTAGQTWRLTLVSVLKTAQHTKKKDSSIMKDQKI